MIDPGPAHSTVNSFSVLGTSDSSDEIPDFCSASGESSNDDDEAQPKSTVQQTREPIKPVQEAGGSVISVTRPSVFHPLRLSCSAQKPVVFQASTPASAPTTHRVLSGKQVPKSGTSEKRKHTKTIRPAKRATSSSGPARLLTRLLRLFV